IVLIGVLVLASPSTRSQRSDNGVTANAAVTVAAVGHPGCGRGRPRTKGPAHSGWRARPGSDRIGKTRHCAADLGAQLTLFARGNLTKEAQSGINLALEWLAHNNLRKGRRSSRGGCVALTIRIGQPCSRDDGDGYPDSDPEFGL